MTGRRGAVMPIGWISISRSCPKCQKFIPKYKRVCPSCGKSVKNIQGRVFAK